MEVGFEARRKYNGTLSSSKILYTFALEHVKYMVYVCTTEDGARLGSTGTLSSSRLGFDSLAPPSVLLYNCSNEN